jgi:hypothetical protein
VKALLTGSALCALSAGVLSFASTTAFVYQSTDAPNTKGMVQQINGYALSSTGQISPIPGGPFAVGDGINSYMACNGSYLFGISWGDLPKPTWQNIVTYKIAPNGALTKVQTTPAASYATTSGPHFLYGPLVLDHSGQFLYAGVTGGSDLYSDYGIMVFRVVGETGALEFLGETPGDIADTETIHFTGDDAFAFDEHNHEYMVAGNKTLVALQNETSAGFGSNDVDPDPLSNLAVIANGGELQSWFVSKSGDLTPHSTGGSAPIHTPLWPAYEMYFAPDGATLAISGYGLDLYHFNGARPITNYMQLVPPGAFDSTTGNTVGTFVSIVGWDFDHHLIVTTQYTDATGDPGPSYWNVYTATPTAVKLAYKEEIPDQTTWGFAVQRLGAAPEPVD